MKKEELIDMAVSLGLKRILHELKVSAKQSIGIEALLYSEELFETGQSKFGGLPHFPDEYYWPRWPDTGNTPLSFVAQINLSDLHLSANTYLPGKGILYFFYEADSQPWGMREDSGAWKVLFYDGAVSALKRRDFPPDLEDRFDPCLLSFRNKTTIPHYPPDPWNVSREETEPYCKLLEAAADDAKIHQMFGYPYILQGDMETECELASRGMTWHDWNAMDADNKSKIRAGAAEWRLLLQLDSDETGTGWAWGDCGIIYFWIKKQDLLMKRFDKCWLILQCL
ncbi:MAG: YwqG family protein [Candidatus Omnitrophota bacterium]